MVKRSSIENLFPDEELKLYEALEEVLREIGEVAVYGFVGPYNSGKDSIMSYLAVHRPDLFARIVGDTNREKRKDDIEGVTHHFRDTEAMVGDLHNQRFVQVAPSTLPGIFYATRPEQYSKDKIGMKAIYAREMANFRRLGFKEVKWLQIVPYSDEVWRQWQGMRKLKAKDRAQRDNEAIQSYTLALTNKDTYFVLNEEIEKAAQRVIQIAQDKRPADEPWAKQIAVRNLEAQKRRLEKIT